jgi:hypothetical protein
MMRIRCRISLINCGSRNRKSAGKSSWMSIQELLALANARWNRA